MAKNFNSSALPEHCYAVLPGSGQLIEVRRGEKGYYPCAYSTSDREYNKVLANYFNAHEGISKAQAAAMLAGSMFGWRSCLLRCRGHPDPTGRKESAHQIAGISVRAGKAHPAELPARNQGCAG